MVRTVDFLCFCRAIRCRANITGHIRYRGQKGRTYVTYDIRYESANYSNFHVQKKRQTILLAMRLVLVVLATFLQSLFNFINLQNLIGLYAFNNTQRRQTWLLLLYTDTGEGREEEINDCIGVYRGHANHGSRSTIMITGFPMITLSSNSEFGEQLLMSL